jgi:hypothetical protein
MAMFMAGYSSIGVVTPRLLLARIMPRPGD